MENPVIIFGASGLGKAAQEIFDSHKIVVFGFLDDDESKHGTEIGEVSVLGKTTDDGYLKYIGKKCEAFIAEDNNKARKATVELLNKRRKVMPVNAIHDQAYLAPSAHIGHGNFVNIGAKVGAEAKIGNHCILNSNVIVEHEAQLSDFVQVGAGSIINSGTKLEEEVFVGSGVTIVAGVKVGKGARIGAGSVVISDVSAGDTVFGNPAQVVKN